uniref:Putative cuticle protein 38 n=2 Tax=Lutzomyia longipalpis TaxID=7200 RepID=A0A7G3AGD7_LUTLO
MKVIAIFLLVAVAVVVAKPKPAVIAYSAPYVAAEPAATVVESTYHGVSAPLVASPYVSTYSAAYSAPLVAAPYAYAAYPYAAGAVYV